MFIRSAAFRFEGPLVDCVRPNMSAELATLFARLLAYLPVAIVSSKNVEVFMRDFVSAFPRGASRSGLYLFASNGAVCLTWQLNCWVPRYEEVLTEAEHNAIHIAMLKILHELPKKYRYVVEGLPIKDLDHEVRLYPLGDKTSSRTYEVKKMIGQDIVPEAHKQLVKLLPEFAVRRCGEGGIPVVRKHVDALYALTMFSRYAKAVPNETLYLTDPTQLRGTGDDCTVNGSKFGVQKVFGPTDTKEKLKDLVESFEGAA